MKINKNELFSFFNRNIGNTCSILKHTCNFGDPNEDVVKSILEKGIINNFYSVRCTCYPFGRLEDERKTANAIYNVSNFNNYNMYSKEEFYNIVVAIPLYFLDSNGHNYFGGIIKPNNMEKKISNYSICTPIEYTMSHKKIIPREFILGYYKSSSFNNYVDFVFNPNYYSFLKQEDKDSFIKENKIDKFIDLNGDIEKQISSNEVILTSLLAKSMSDDYKVHIEYIEQLNNIAKETGKRDLHVYPDKFFEYESISGQKLSFANLSMNHSEILINLLKNDPFIKRDKPNLNIDIALKDIEIREYYFTYIYNVYYGLIKELVEQKINDKKIK